MALLAGRVAIVTGAGRGLGRAHALALAREGARVVVDDPGCDVDGAGGDPGVARAVVEEIRAAGGEAVASDVAVGTLAAGEELVRVALDAFGRLDVLVNNAGISLNRPVVELDLETWERVLRVHLTGAFACARAALAVMRAAGHGGRIINTTSGAALDHVYAGTAAYAAAKGGVASLTRVLALEGAPFGITCNAVAPLARTRMSGAFLADEHDDDALDPAAVTPLVLHLASPASDGVSGHVFCFRRGRIALARIDVGEGIIPAEPWTVDEVARRMPEILRGA